MRREEAARKSPVSQDRHRWSDVTPSAQTGTSYSSSKLTSRRQRAPGKLSPMPLLLCFFIATALQSVAALGVADARLPSGPVFDGRRGATTVATPRIDRPATVDGVLDEPAWASAAVLTGFSQFFPTDGVAAEDSTEVLVWYSATALHVGIRAFAL